MSIKKLNIQKMLNWISAFGIALSLVGLFLPWGRQPWQVLGLLNYGYYTGIEILMGDFTLIGCLWSLGFLVRSFKRPLQPTALAFAGELAVALFSIFWILDPNIISYFWYSDQGNLGIASSFYSWTTVYGVYISFLGALIALSALSLRKFMRNKINLENMILD